MVPKSFWQKRTRTLVFEFLVPSVLWPSYTKTSVVVWLIATDSFLSVDTPRLSILGNKDFQDSSSLESQEAHEEGGSKAEV